jgi:glycosyltransferase involved in cell wall biosynthesis
MACGLPVIASTAKGLEDIFPVDLPSGGVRFPSGDVDALSAAIQKLRNDPALRHRLGLQAREAVRRLFSIASVGERLASLLRSQSLSGPSPND